MNNNLTNEESLKRNQLKIEKPYVYEKILKYKEKVEREESIAILQFQYDYKCNFFCEHCSADKFMPKHMKDKSKKRFFTIEDIKELSKQGDEMGLANIVITGGEPLIFPDFDEIVKAIDPEKWYIVSDSNGWLLDDKKAKHLKTIGVDKIQLSLDSAYAEEHDRFRNKKGSYDRVIRAIDASLKAGLNTILSTVVWKQRAKSDEFIEFLEMAKSKGVGTFVSFAKPVGNWEGNLDSICSSEEIDYVHSLADNYNVFSHLTPGYGIDVGCIAVKRMVSLTKYGDIMPCPYTHLVLGNFFDEPLKDIINRGLKIKKFSYDNKETCFMANTDDEFITKYLPKIQGKGLAAVPYYDVFDKEDFIDNELPLKKK